MLAILLRTLVKAAQYSSNQGTTHFKGIPRQYSRYNEQMGLSEPTSKNKIDRDRRLDYWKRDVAELEMDIARYC